MYIRNYLTSFLKLTILRCLKSLPNRMLNSLFYHFITSIYRKNNEVQKYQRPVIRKQQEIWNRPYVHMYILVCAYTRTIPWLWT